MQLWLECTEKFSRCAGFCSQHQWSKAAKLLYTLVWLKMHLSECRNPVILRQFDTFLRNSMSLRGFRHCAPFLFAGRGKDKCRQNNTDCNVWWTAKRLTIYSTLHRHLPFLYSHSCQWPCRNFWPLPGRVIRGPQHAFFRFLFLGGNRTIKNSLWSSKQTSSVHLALKLQTLPFCVEANAVLLDCAWNRNNLHEFLWGG